MDATWGHPDHAHTSVSASALQTVFSTHLSDSDARDYDEFVARAQGTHYSQARCWANVAAAAKPVTPYYFLVRRGNRIIGAALVLRGRLSGFPLPIAQVERGPVCDRREDIPDVLDALHSASLRHGIARLSVMPYWSDEPRALDAWLDQKGFADHQGFAGRHARSLRIDLTAIDEKEPFGAPNLAKTRQAIRRAERAGATARQAAPEDMQSFRRMHEELQQLGGKALPADAWYEALAGYFCGSGGQGAAFVSEFEGQPIAVVLITNHGGLATYALGASSGLPVKFPKMVLPISHAILWAKQAGARTFDLGGIPLQGDPDPKRASIAEFKYGFSHTEISLVHEHVRWF